MTTGNLRIRIALLLGWLITPGWAVAWGLDELFAGLAAQPRSEVHFVEERHDQLLGLPLRSEGILRYQAPDYLSKTIERGGEGSYEFSAGQLRIERRGAQHELALDSHPLLLAISTALRATLAGDRAALEQYFELRLAGQHDDWQLRLHPLDGAVARVLREIHIQGADARILRIESEERSGDRVITILRHGDAR